MKKFSNSSKSSSSKKKVNYKFDMKDDSIMKVKWTSPKDQKENVLDIKGGDINPYTIKIKDNH